MVDPAAELAMPPTALPPTGMVNVPGLDLALMLKIIRGLANGLSLMVAIFIHPLLATTLPLV